MSAPNLKICSASEATEDQVDNHENQRRFERYPTCLRAILNTGARFQTTTIENISRGGAALASASGVMPNDTIVLEFLNGRRLEAKVRWWVNGRCGIAFYEHLPANDPLIELAIRRRRA